MPKKSESSSPEPTPDKKKKVLDLIETPKKPSRRERQRAEAAEAVETTPLVKTVDDAKREALDLFAEDKKPKVRKTTKSGTKSVLPTISKILDPSEDPSLVPAPEPEPAAAPAPAPEAEAAPAEDAAESDAKFIVIKPPILVSELANRLGQKQFKIMADLIKLSVFVAPNQPIEPEIAAKVCEIYGFKFEREKREKGGGVHKVEEKVVEPAPVKIEPEDKLKLRAPIITIMGHVDHGKTTLLDRIRNAKVAAGEAGGITQHIGAYQIEHNGLPVTFLDTPGHAIFSDMRARGADITDIVVIVVAANDGIMPQTREAIKHAQAAKKTIIVAINKCDLPSANIERVKTQLAENGLQTLDYGGDTEFVEVSALTGAGIDNLMELLALQAEVLELKANPKGNTRASVIEARTVQGRGTCATVIVESGTLKTGMPFICGPFSGKVKVLINDRGETVKQALPGMPVEVIGFEELPNVGDHLVEMKNEREAKALAAERQEEQRRIRLKPVRGSRMEDLYSMVNDGGGKAQLKLILKGDVQGSVEAIKKACLAIESEKVECVFVGGGVGPINESDVQYAASTKATILGFNQKVEGKAVRAAKADDVQIKLYTIVYELIDQVREAMLGLLDPLTRENILGHAEVRQIFKVGRNRAAGSYIKDGKVHRKAHARVIRGGVPVFDGKMSTLRRFQDEVEEVRNGYECGIRLGDFNEYQEGDIIECYTLEKIPQTL